MARPTITKITLEIDGTTSIDVKNPEDTMALFFTDSAIKYFMVSHYYARGEETQATAVEKDWNADLLGVAVLKRPNCTYEVVTKP